MQVRRPRTAIVVGARSVAAVPSRLCPPLWAALLRGLALRDAEDLLARLLRRGWLRPAGDDLAWDPAARAVALDGLATRAPSAWTRANRVCAGFFARRSADGDLGAAVDHLLAIGDRRAAMALLERARPDLGTPDGAAALVPVFERLRRGTVASPAWFHYAEARAREGAGDLAGALDAYARVPSRVAAGRAPRWLPVAADVHAHAGLLALRLGRVVRAETELEAARHVAGRRAMPAVEHLAARLELARGHLGSAERRFERAARAAARAGDAAEHGEALSGLGVIAMRQGDPRRAQEHYRRALVASAAAPDEARHARIQANYAMALALTGQWDAAARFEDAARVREALGDVAGAANSIAAGASAKEGAGNYAGAAEDLARARMLAEVGGDPALLMEIRLLRANLAARRDQIAAARADLRAAEAIRRDIEQPDPLLDGMLEESRAEVFAASRAHVEAACAGRRARRTFARNGAEYLVARVELLLARNAHAAGRDAAALAHLAAVARRAVAPGYRFPSAWAAARVVRLAAAKGRDDLCAAITARGAAGETSIAPRTLHETGAHRVLDRRGARIAGGAEIAHLRATGAELFVDVPRQLVVTRDGERSLRGRRVLLPLLLALLEKPDRPFDAEQLHSEAWGSDRFDDSARTRLKVALSRLRAVVGAGVVETHVSATATGATRTRYGVRRDLDFVVLDRG